MVHRVLFLLLMVGALVPGLSHAARFDFIFADQITMRAPLESWWISLGQTDFGVIVNKGTGSLGADELNAAAFHVTGVPEWPDTTSTLINPCLRPGFNSGYLYHQTFQPIQPDEAVGSVWALNSVLLPLVGASETFRNSSPAPLLYLEMGGNGNSPGTVGFNGQLCIGDEAVAFTIHVTLIDSPTYSIEFTHASRASSSAGTGNLLPTAARTTTWGALKSLYR